jgi:anti-sigma factor RsiW
VNLPVNHVEDEVLTALVDEQLPPSERSEVVAHLAGCAQCQDRVEGFRSVATLLRRLPEVEPPRDFNLGPRLLADPPNVVRLRRWYTATRAAAAVLAATFVFLAAGALYVASLPGRVPTAVVAQAPRVVPPPASAGVSAPPTAAPRSAAAAAPAVARPAELKPQPDDQVAAATSVNPLPTPVPTPQPSPRPIPAPAQLSSEVPDPAAPLRATAVLSGVLAVLALLFAMRLRHRLRRIPSQL